MTLTRTPAWWPPEVGDRMRRIPQDAPVRTVVAVFKHDEETFAVFAWMPIDPTKRWWHYEIASQLEAQLGAFWPAGQERPGTFQPKSQERQRR